MNKKIGRISILLFFLLLTVVFSVSADVDEDFSTEGYIENGWQQNVLLGNPNGAYIYPERRRLSIRLPNYDTYVYMYNENAESTDVTVEGTFENILPGFSSYSLFCRWHDYGWYEFKVNISGPEAGSYVVYKYDQYLKTQYKNPYVRLHPNFERFNSYDIKLGVNKKNKLKFICKDDEFRIFINDVEQKPLKGAKLKDSDFEDGFAGFSVNSYSGGPVQIDITRFKAYPPTNTE